jgi:rhodanese-related sulfurtransferase
MPTTGALEIDLEAFAREHFDAVSVAGGTSAWIRSGRAVVTGESAT